MLKHITTHKKGYRYEFVDLIKESNHYKLGMDIENKRNTVSVSLNFISGTTKQVLFNSVLPTEKASLELFWVNQLLEKMGFTKPYKTFSNQDDSNHKSDVVVKDNKNNQIGVQITELTYYLERTRKAIKEDFINKLMIRLNEQKIISDNKICISLYINENNKVVPDIDTVEKTIKYIKDAMQYKDEIIREYGKYRISIRKLKPQEEFFVPNISNIGVNFLFDQVGISIPYYEQCVDNIYNKKSKSSSEWLVIWSKDFWRNAYWLEEEITEYMKNLFLNSKFKKVYFIHSQDGDGIFQQNLKHHEIK